MKIKTLFISFISAVLFSLPALAELTFPYLRYKSGAYAVNGIPYADGWSDYMTLLNERDGGIGGVKINAIECETQYKTDKGVECYENTKGKGSLLYHPMSTGITYQLIPKATADNIPLLSMGYGRTSAANGKIFSHVFNLLDARGVISPTERQNFISRVRELARMCAEALLESEQEELGAKK